jgi:hypothetical protein
MSGARSALRALTPKEFSDAIGGLLCARTVRDYCREGRLPTVNGAGRRPYFIRPTALRRYRVALDRFAV